MRRGGRTYVAAPVQGNPDFAHSRRLFILAAERPQAVTRVKPLLESLGQRVFVIADAAGGERDEACWKRPDRGDAAKHGRSAGLLRKDGIDRQVAFDVFTGSLFDAKVHKD